MRQVIPIYCKRCTNAMAASMNVLWNQSMLKQEKELLEKRNSKIAELSGQKLAQLQSFFLQHNNFFTPKAGSASIPETEMKFMYDNIPYNGPPLEPLNHPAASPPVRTNLNNTLLLSAFGDRANNGKTGPGGATDFSLDAQCTVKTQSMKTAVKVSMKKGPVSKSAMKVSVMKSAPAMRSKVMSMKSVPVMKSAMKSAAKKAPLPAVKSKAMKTSTTHASIAKKKPRAKAMKTAKAMKSDTDDSSSELNGEPHVEAATEDDTSSSDGEGKMQPMKKAMKTSAAAVSGKGMGKGRKGKGKGRKGKGKGSKNSADDEEQMEMSDPLGIGLLGGLLSCEG